MDWFMHHPVLLALVCAAVAVGYGLWLTFWLLKQPGGNERMREIAGAVQEGASAYLRRQYTTIAMVAIAPFVLIGFYDKLGWGTAFGFLIGAGLGLGIGTLGAGVQLVVALKEQVNFRTGFNGWRRGRSSRSTRRWPPSSTTWTCWPSGNTRR